MRCKMDPGIAKCPTLSQVENSIKKVKQIEWPIYDFRNDTPKGFAEKIRGVSFSIFGVLPYKHRKLKPTALSSLYRVREWDQIRNVNLFTEHSYPPPDITGFGRCNFPNYPVFYSSDNPMISLIEVIRKEKVSKKSFCISKWEINNNKTIEIVLSHYLNGTLPKENPYYDLDRRDRSEMTEIFPKTYSDEQIKGFNKIIDFFNSQFMTDKNYHISASLIYDIFFEGPKPAADIVMYPSVQSEYKGNNFALHPNFVDNMLELKRIYKVQVSDFCSGDETVQVTFEQYADFANNKPIWKNLPEDGEERIDFLRKDFKYIEKC